jgi:hypothetical protein
MSILLNHLQDAVDRVWRIVLDTVQTVEHSRATRRDSIVASHPAVVFGQRIMLPVAVPPPFGRIETERGADLSRRQNAIRDNSAHGGFKR